MPWLAALAAPVIGTIAGSLFGGGGSTPTSGGSSALYMPTNLPKADASWLWANQQQNHLVDNMYSRQTPAYQQTFDAQNRVSYLPYEMAAKTAGDQYASLAAQVAAQGNQYDQAANLATQQQQAMYGAGQNILTAASDPNNALYGRTQQQLLDQVRSGQAARGIGNSPVGAAEENQALSNFNIDWQNQQLARMQTGIQGAVQANQSGGQQGQLMGANLAASLNATTQQPVFTQQTAQIPLSAAQYVAGQPAANANAYGANMSTLASQYGPLQTQPVQYMNQGQGAQATAQQLNQAQQQLNNTQSQGISTGVSNLINGLTQPNKNNPNGWLSSLFTSPASSTNSTNTGGQYSDYFLPGGSGGVGYGVPQ